MSKDQGRGSFCSKARKVHTVPGWDGGGKDAGIRSQGEGRIVSYAKAIAIMRPPCVHAETTVVRLLEDRVLWRQYQVGKQDRISSLVDLTACQLVGEVRATAQTNQKSTHERHRPAGLCAILFRLLSCIKGRASGQKVHRELSHCARW